MRGFALRVAVLCALLATLLALHVAVARPNLPLALLDSFDQAFSLVYEAAERKVAAIEAAQPAASAAPAGRDVFAILSDLGDRIAAMCDAASAALDVELAVADSLSPGRRSAALGCLEHHLGDARTAASRARDPELRAEYEVTCARLREVRKLI